MQVGLGGVRIYMPYRGDRMHDHVGERGACQPTSRQRCRSRRCEVAGIGRPVLYGQVEELQQPGEAAPLLLVEERGQQDGRLLRDLDSMECGGSGDMLRMR